MKIHPAERWEELFDKKVQQISSQFIQVSCGMFHTVALTNAGEVFVWGANNKKQHGLCEKSQLMRSIKVQLKRESLLPEEYYPSILDMFGITRNKIITQVTCGYEYTIAIENKRACYAWGRNQEGQLGIDFRSEFEQRPTKVLGLDQELIRQVSAGETHTLFLTEAGEVFSCGDSLDGKLGVGVRTTLQLKPQKIRFLQHIVKVAAGQTHSLALGLDLIERKKKIQLGVTNLARSNIKQVIYSWGNGWESKLGHGNRLSLFLPQQINSNMGFTDIAAGSRNRYLRRGKLSFSTPSSF